MQLKIAESETHEKRYFASAFGYELCCQSRHHRGICNRVANSCGMDSRNITSQYSIFELFSHEADYSHPAGFIICFPLAGFKARLLEKTGFKDYRGDHHPGEHFNISHLP